MLGILSFYLVLVENYPNLMVFLFGHLIIFLPYRVNFITSQVTILNSMDIVGWIKQPIVYRPFTKRNGHRLRVRFTHSERLWPWVGYLAVHLDVESNVNEPVPSSRFSGIAEGVITFTVESAHPVNIINRI